MNQQQPSVLPAAPATAPGAGRVLFVYWGRRGALSVVAAGIARSLAMAGTADAVSYSAENELAPEIAAVGTAFGWRFPTFRSGVGAITGLPRFFRQRRRLIAELDSGRFRAVVVLMSHVWTPLLGRAIRRSGLRYVVIVHDARPHPGDATALVNRWLARDVRNADLVVTLTEAVQEALLAEHPFLRGRVTVVPHPVVHQGRPRGTRQGGPLRVLFLGRIMAYKGLPLLVGAMEDLRRRGVDVALGVYGEGNIEGLRNRLAALDAMVVNRWIEHAEIGAILAQHDVVVLPYIEASQSGITPAAHGAGLPVIVTPVGGLAEQVRHGVDGLIAASVAVPAIADALEALARDPALLERLRAGAAESGTFDVPAFAARLRELALGTSERS